MNDLGENIVALRKQNKLSQGDLAKKLYVTPQAISRWERGATEPDIETIKQLAELFHVTTDEIIYGPTSKLSKKMTKILHKSYIVGSVLMVVLSITFAILAILDIDYIFLLIMFVSIAAVYFLFLMICEIIQNKLRKIPVRKSDEK